MQRMDINFLLGKLVCIFFLFFFLFLFFCVISIEQNSIICLSIILFRVLIKILVFVGVIDIALKLIIITGSITGVINDKMFYMKA